MKRICLALTLTVLASFGALQAMIRHSSRPRVTPYSRTVAGQRPSMNPSRTGISQGHGKRLTQIL